MTSIAEQPTSAVQVPPQPQPVGPVPRRTLAWGRIALIPLLTLALTAAGAWLRLVPSLAHLAQPVWMVGLVALGGWVVGRTVLQAARGHFATDLVAAMAIITAAVIGMPLPGLIVVLMQTGGEALEEYARGRASRAVRALEDAAPRRAHRISDGAVTDIDVEAISAGDTLLVRPGEMIPCARRRVRRIGHRHLAAHRRAGAGPRPAGRAPHERQPQRRAVVHRARHCTGPREPVRAHCRARALGPGEQGAAAAAG